MEASARVSVRWQCCRLHATRWSLSIQDEARARGAGEATIGGRFASVTTHGQRRDGRSGRGTMGTMGGDGADGADGLDGADGGSDARRQIGRYRDRRHLQSARLQLETWAARLVATLTACEMGPLDDLQGQHTRRGTHDASASSQVQHQASRITQQHGRPRPSWASRLTSSSSLQTAARVVATGQRMLAGTPSCRPRPAHVCPCLPVPAHAHAHQIAAAGSPAGPICDPPRLQHCGIITILHPPFPTPLSPYAPQHPAPAPAPAPASAQSKCGPQQPVAWPSSIGPLFASGQWWKFTLQIAPARAA